MDELLFPRAPRRGDVFDATIERIGDKGEGIATLPMRIGPDKQKRRFAVHIRGTLPGERVTFEVSKRHKKLLNGHLRAIIEPSPDRAEPTCRHFGAPDEAGRGCGGCALQNLTIDAQRAAKQRRVAGLLKQAGLDPALVQPTLAGSEPFFYRNKMELSFGNDADRTFSLGLHPAGFRYQTLNLSECHLMSPFASAFAPKIRLWAQENEFLAYDARTDEGFLRTLTLREGKRTGQRMAVLETEMGVEPDGLGDSFVAACHAAAAELDGRIDSLWWVQRSAARGTKTLHKEHLLDGAAHLDEELHLPGGRKLAFAIAPRAFFQPSTSGAEAIYGEVIRQLGVEDGGSAGKTVVDLYCGTGTIALCVAPSCGDVVGIELNEPAVANATANAAANGITNARFIAGDAADVLQRERLNPRSIDTVIVDPPRAGLSPDAIAQVLRLAPERIIYVACRPESLARDAALLADKGYVLTTVQPVDQFPQTGHVECVASLVRSSATD